MSASTSASLIETDTDLPEGWVSVELGSHVYIAGRIGWRGLKAEEYTPSGPVLLSVPNLNHGDHVDFSKVNHISVARYDESPEIKLKVGDTLLVKDGAGIGKLGYVAHLPGESTVNSSLLVVRPTNELLDSKYLFQYLKGPALQGIAQQRITGSSTPHLFQKDIKRFRVLVPPLAEQKRIVEKVEQLSAHVNTARERLASVPAILKRFRQTVLTTAFTGQLTEDWENSCPSSESADQFLNRFALGAGIGADQESEPDSPVGWASCSFERLFSVETGGTPSRKNPLYYRDGDIPWVKTGEVHNCDIFQAEESITSQAVSETNAKLFPVGTILIAMYGEGKTRGQVGRLRIDAATNQACAALVNTNLPPETNAYVYYYCLSQYSKFREKAFGGNQPNLNLSLIKRWKISFPSLALQREIVRRIKGLFKLADSIEKRVAAAIARAEKLTQGVLAKAFRGELVPTEAELARREGRSYESAADLLARIRSERSDEEHTPSLQKEKKWPTRSKRKTRNS